MSFYAGGVACGHLALGTGGGDGGEAGGEAGGAVGNSLGKNPGLHTSLLDSFYTFSTIAVHSLIGSDLF